MSILVHLGIAAAENSAVVTFESLMGDFLSVVYDRPSTYVANYMQAYQSRSASNENNRNLHGRIFEYVLATLCVREGLFPLYLNAKVAFVPNVDYDLLLHSSSCGPICLSAKTSLRERYKQADLEAIALKYVHRKARSYLLTLEPHEAVKMQEKIESGAIIGLDRVVLATSPGFDDLINELKTLSFSEPPSVKVIESNLVVSSDRVNSVIGAEAVT
jgi:hypothetical protein